MTITSESQIINLEGVNVGLSQLDDAISYIDECVAQLNNAKKHSDSEVILMSGTNTFTERINVTINNLNNTRNTILSSRVKFYDEAQSLYTAQRAAYQRHLDYLREQERIRIANELRQAEMNKLGGNI